MHRAAGFSLLELIGVMAVMAILAGALAPAVFQMVQEARQTAETKSLAAISQSLAAAVQRDKTIPTANAADWSQSVSNYAAIAEQSVLTNENQFQRRLYFDPRFFQTSDQNFPGYTQTTGLASAPNSPRAMLVSSLDGEINENLNTQSRFNAVWDQTAGARITESKTVFVERLNLASLFKRVLLANASTNQVGYQLEGGAEAAIPAASGGIDGVRTLYVIRGTRLSLNVPPYPSSTPQRQLLVNEDVSVRYTTDGSTWYWE